MKLLTGQQPLRLNRWLLLSLIAMGEAWQLAVDAGLKGNVLGTRELSVFLDPLAHVVLAIIVVFPWIVALQLPSFHLPLAAASAVLIDIDHLVAAGSLSVKDAITLPMRPVSHSVLFCLGLAVILGLIARRLSVMGIVFIALLTHVSRDATSGGTPWLWPLVQAPRIPMGLHIGLWLTVAISGVFWTRRSQQKS